MDYILSALKGLKSDHYIPGSFPCANNSKYFIIDTERTVTNFKIKSTDTMLGKEDVIFNTTATCSGYLPDVIYYCYFVPSTGKKAWINHY